MNSTPWPAVDRSFQSALAQREPTPFSHGLSGDPRFSLDAIARLGDELGADSISAEKAVEAARLGRRRAPTNVLEVVAVSDQIRALAANDSWFTLLNIEQSEPYRELVDQLLEGMAANAGLDPRTMKRRMGFVFASSPGSVTSAHFDIEHSFLLQLEGHRRSASAGSRARRTASARSTATGTAPSAGSTPCPSRPSSSSSAPGQGAYIPPYTPHWLANGDSTSLSLTVTFFNRDNADESMVQAFNEKVGRLGIDPKVYGDAPVRDRRRSRSCGPTARPSAGSRGPRPQPRTDPSGGVLGGEPGRGRRRRAPYAAVPTTRVPSANDDL